MEIRYLVQIEDPQYHIVTVRMTGEIHNNESRIEVYIPSWSPGSYLMREYGRNIRTFKALADNGEALYFEQCDKNTWCIDLEKSDLKKQTKNFEVTYEIYCHDLTVRTSHVDESHAFLHGPSTLMTIVGSESKPGEIEFKFPPLWSKIHTGLKEISKKREEFVFSFDNYDMLADCPVEIGCHESDGFMHDGKEHYVTFYGEQYPHPYDLKADMKTIVETVSSHFSSIPYDDYLFMTHFAKDVFGGLEHKNSTALQYDGRKLGDRNSYINWLALVAHEYFHTWNVKRIRPKELGPFDYRNENYTRMHWLTEGLTSFMDEIFVLRSGLCTLEEYLDMQKTNLTRYYAIPGKKFHSLEDSSFNAWIKLYRPDEFHNNSSISYYLKGGLVFSVLHGMLKDQGKSINDLLTLMWDHYLANPEVGLVKEEVLDMVTKLGGEDVTQKFETMLSTTQDIDFETMYLNNGMKFVWSEPKTPFLGTTFRFSNNQVFIDKIELDSPAYKAGLNAGDEILMLAGQRFLQADAMGLDKLVQIDKPYELHISRLGKLQTIDVTFGKAPRTLDKIEVTDEKKANDFFGS